MGGAKVTPLTRFERACLVVVAAAFLVRLGFLLGPIVIWFAPETRGQPLPD